MEDEYIQVLEILEELDILREDLESNCENDSDKEKYISKIRDKCELLVKVSYGR